MHVVDITHESALEQSRTVEQTLHDLGLGERSQLMVLNKADLLTERLGNPLQAMTDSAGGLWEWPPQALRVSSAKGWGLDELLLRIERALATGGTEADYREAYQGTYR